MSRPHHPALVREGPGEWSLREWLHQRDGRRVLAEPWPFSWTVPACGWAGDGQMVPPHPLEARRRQAARYAAQAALYADAFGVRNLGEAASECGTHLHRLAEEFASGEAPAGSRAWRRRNGGV